MKKEDKEKNMYKYSCSICKDKLEKYRKSKRVRFVPKNLLLWMFDYKSKKEVIEHIKKSHPKIYKKVMKNKTVLK